MNMGLNNDLDNVLGQLSTQDAALVRKKLDVPSQHALTAETASFTSLEQITHGYSLAVAQSNGQVGYFIIADGMEISAKIPEDFKAVNPKIKATASVTKAVDYFTALAAYVFGDDNEDDMIEQQAKIRSLGKYLGEKNPFKANSLDATLRSKGLTADSNLLGTALEGYAYAINAMVLEDEKKEMGDQQDGSLLQVLPATKRGLRLSAGIIVGDRLSYLTVGDAGIYKLAVKDNRILVVQERANELQGNVTNYLGKPYDFQATVGEINLQQEKIYFTCNRALRNRITEIDFSLLHELSPETIVEKTQRWYNQFVATASKEKLKKSNIITWMRK